MKGPVFLLLGLTACFVGVDGIRCYKCDYSNAVPSYNSYCGDNFDADDAVVSIVTCEGDCYKSRGEIFNVYGLDRGCRENSTLDGCANACGSYENTSGCEHCCDTDLCNAASTLTFHLATSGAMMLFSLIL